MVANIKHREASAYLYLLEKQKATYTALHHKENRV